MINNVFMSDGKPFFSAALLALLKTAFIPKFEPSAAKPITTMKYGTPEGSTARKGRGPAKLRLIKRHVFPKIDSRTGYSTKLPT